MYISVSPTFHCSKIKLISTMYCDTIVDHWTYNKLEQWFQNCESRDFFSKNMWKRNVFFENIVKIFKIFQSKKSLGNTKIEARDQWQKIGFQPSLFLFINSKRFLYRQTLNSFVYIAKGQTRSKSWFIDFYFVCTSNLKATHGCCWSLTQTFLKFS